MALYLVYTYDGTTLKGYLDGVEAVSQAKSFTLTGNTVDLYLGASIFRQLRRRQYG
ncbi:MAG: hypothetical protein U0X91_30520 [Spirosomataceae bacterium]